MPHMKSLLPIVIIVLLLTAAITYSLAKKAAPKDINRFGISANQLTNITTPQFKFDTGDVVTPTTAKVTPTITPLPTVTPSIKAELPVVTETPNQTKGGQSVAITKTRTVTVCTPVYGMANTCTEHVVVDTGASDSIFFNLAGLSYLGGLVAFVKAKSAKK